MQAQTGQSGRHGCGELLCWPGAGDRPPRPVNALKVTPEDLRLRAGEAAEMGVVGYDTFRNVVPVQPVWQVTAGMGSITPATP